MKWRRNIEITFRFETGHCLQGFILLWIGSQEQTDIKTKWCDEANIKQQDHHQIPLPSFDVTHINPENSRFNRPTIHRWYILFIKDLFVLKEKEILKSRILNVFGWHLEISSLFSNIQIILKSHQAYKRIISSKKS